MELSEDHDPSPSSVACQCASGPLGDSIIDLLERKVMKFHEVINYKCP